MRATGRETAHWPTGVHAALLSGQVVLLGGLELWHLLHQR
jgi:hypothetical protein